MTRSRTEFERQSLEKIERQILVLMALEERLKRSSPKDERDLRDMVEAAVQDVDHPGATLTLVEAMGGGNGRGAKVGSDGSNEQEITLPF